MTDPEPTHRAALVTDPERVVIVIEYEAAPYSEQWFKDVVTNLRQSVDTTDQAPIKPVQLYIAIKDHADRVLDVFKEAGRHD